MVTYRDRIRAYERTALWRARSRLFRVQHGYFCDACGRKGRIDAHHIQYGKLDGMEPDWMLRGLCRDCHTDVHERTRHGANLPDATNAVIRAQGRRKRKRGLRRLLSAAVIGVVWGAGPR